MTLPDPQVEIDGIPRPDPADWWVARSPLLNEPLRRGWPSIALGVIFAGGFYPILVAVGGIAIELLGGGPTGPEDIVELAFIIVILALFGFVIGMVWANVTLVVTLPAVLLVVWTLELRGSMIRLGAVWGGAVGFVSLLPFWLMNEFHGGWLVPLLIGPGLTTLLGQMGGAWGGRRAVHRLTGYERSLQHASSPEQSATGNSHVVGATMSELPDAVSMASQSRPFQFSIRHLMWIAVWVSLLLSLIRLVGIPLEGAAPLLVGWLLYQSVTLWMGGLVVRKLGWWSEVSQASVSRGTTGRADAACAFHVERAIGRALPDDVTREVVSRETEGGK